MQTFRDRCEVIYFIKAICWIILKVKSEHAFTKILILLNFDRISENALYDVVNCVWISMT